MDELECSNETPFLEKTSGKIVSKNVCEEDGDDEGGLRGWIIAFAAFSCQGVLGMLFCYSVLYEEIYLKWKAENIPNASSKAALVGSLPVGLLFLASPISGNLVEIYGVRATCLFGSALVTSGLFLASFCQSNVIGLTFFYGIVVGMGAALVYSPSLAVLGFHFKKHLVLVNGIVTSGECIFFIAMPYFVTTLFRSVEFGWTLKILSMISVICILVSVIFDSKPKTTSSTSGWKTFMDFSVFKNVRFATWCFGISVGSLGCMTPYTYITDYVRTDYGENFDRALPVLLIGISQLVGRLFFGFVGFAAERFCSRMTIQMIALFGSGCSIILIPLVKPFYLFNIFSFLFGFFDSGFLSLISPIGFDICGREEAPKAISLAFGATAIPIIIGPFLAGLILEKTESYTIPFVVSGLVEIVGVLLLTSAEFVKKKPQNNDVQT